MGIREIILLVVLPMLVFMIFASFKMIDQRFEQKKCSRLAKIGYKYVAILCPPLAFILLKLQK